MNGITLLTGGTGLVGGEVALALAARGRLVRAVVRARSPSNARQRLLERIKKSRAFSVDLARLLEAVPGDSTLDEFGCGKSLLAGVSTIIHCAANTSFSKADRDSIHDTNIGGAKTLVELVSKSAPQTRIFLVSTASVVTGPNGARVDESARFEGYENDYTRSKREAEAIVSRSRLDVVILRPSVVLSRGVSDRAMARSILWCLPIMTKIREVPIDPCSWVDLVPVDHVAKVIALLAVKPALAHRIYHISAGDNSHTFGDVLAAIVKRHPVFSRIKPVGALGAPQRRQSRLMQAIESYLPFMNANVRYDNGRLRREIGVEACPPAATAYVPELMGLITIDEARSEMVRP